MPETRGAAGVQACANQELGLSSATGQRSYIGPHRSSGFEPDSTSLTGQLREAEWGVRLLRGINWRRI